MKFMKENVYADYVVRTLQVHAKVCTSHKHSITTRCFDKNGGLTLQCH